MKIAHKIVLGFLLVALMIGLIGYFGLNANRVIVKSFAGGQENFRVILMAAAEVSSNVKRAEGHLMLYLALHDEVDREKFFKRYNSLLEQIDILDERVVHERSRKIVEEIKSGKDDLLLHGKALLEAYDRDIQAGVSFDPQKNRDLIKKFHDASSTIRRKGVILDNIETDFLNKQESITAATEVSSYIKRAEGHLMLYLALHDEVDREKFFKRYNSLLEQIDILDERVVHERSRKIVEEIKSGKDDLLLHGKALLEAYDRDIQAGVSFDPLKNRDLIKKFHDASSGIRKLGVNLAHMNIDHQHEKLSIPIKKASQIEGSFVMIIIITIFSVIAVGMWVTRMVASPIGQLQGTLLEFGEGNYGVQAEVKSTDEIGQLSLSFNEMAEKLLKTTISKDYLDSIFQSMIDSLIVVSPEGKVVTVNQAALDLLGYKEQEIMNRPIDSIFAHIKKDEKEEFNDLFAADAFNQGSPSHKERVLLSKDGIEIPVRLSSSSFYRSDGEMDGIVYIACDISERKRIEKKMAESIKELQKTKNELLFSNRELANLNANLKDAYEQLMELDQVKSDFVANVSHELRTPLTSVKSFSEILLDDDEKLSRDERSKYLIIINNEADRLTRLINDLLNLRAIEESSISWKDEEVDLNELVSETIYKFKFMLEESGMAISYEMADDLPVIFVDKDKIIQVLSNLFSNAIKHTPSGGTIRMGADVVPCSGEENSLRQVVFYVEDDGPGIEPEDHDRIFEKFQQAGASVSGNREGVGLGLKICKDIVEHYGGTIGIESEAGKGCRFSFTVPVVKHY